jgi:hypothetical protein
MRSFFVSLSLAALLCSGAHATVPIFAATCSQNVKVDADRTGTVRGNGHQASLRTINADSLEARYGGVTYSIMREGGGVQVAFTGPRRANGICTVTGVGSAPTTAAAPAGRPTHSESAGQGQFDARAQIPRAQHKGQPMAQWPIAVARDPGSSATVVVTRPDGRTHAIFFEKGRATGADLSQADGNMTFRATAEADLDKIQPSDERYEIPEAAVFGG